MLLDHIVIHVNDLEAAIVDYRSLGFTVTPGGEHADGNSHNALISFADGAYLELIAFKRPPPPEHLFARGAAQGEGIITYALLPDDIVADVATAKERGLDLEGPYPGGRFRPDGVRLEWQTARASTPDLPFLCADVTPRELRVPGGAATKHANGVMGIANIWVVVQNLEVSMERYSRLLGVEPVVNPRDSIARIASFMLHRTIIIVARPDKGPVLQHLEHRGDGPYMLALRASGDPASITLDPALSHGAKIAIAYGEIAAAP
jgi:hypothetical protein